jgi:hypothetical protein
LPLAAPPLLAHSLAVKHVPLRADLYNNRIGLFKQLKNKEIVLAFLLLLRGQVNVGQK